MNYPGMWQLFMQVDFWGPFHSLRSMNLDQDNGGKGLVSLLQMGTHI